MMEIRARYNHTRTQREGWKLTETTFEVKLSASDTMDGDSLDNATKEWFQIMHTLGVSEADRRNREEQSA